MITNNKIKTHKIKKIKKCKTRRISNLVFISKGSALFIKTQLQHTYQVKTMTTKHKDSLIVIKHSFFFLQCQYK